MIKFGNSGKIILGLVNLEHLVFVVLEKKSKKELNLNIQYVLK
jgi:hypothetical protein